MTGPIRLLDLGKVSPVRSQALYHGLAEAISENAPDTIAFLSPASPYFCVGFHQNPAEELDLAWCRLRRYPVLHRRIGGGTVYLDSDQLFYQCVFHRSRAPFDVASIYGRFLAAPVEALRQLGLDARLTGVNEIEVGTRRIAGTGGGQIGEAMVVTGNILFDFDYDAMARAWRVPSEAFRRLAAAGLNRYMTTLKRELRDVPPAGEVKRLLVEVYAENLGRPLVSGRLTRGEEEAIARVAPELTGARWIGEVTDHRERELKIARGVYVRQNTVSTPAGPIRVAALLLDGAVEDLVLLEGSLSGGLPGRPPLDSPFGSRTS